MEDTQHTARMASQNGADLGSLSRSISDEGTVVCPFPQSWYPAGSPCAKTNDTITGSEQEPWVLPEDKSRLSALWGDITALGPAVKMLGYIAIGLTATWLAIRGMEAYATISKD